MKKIALVASVAAAMCVAPVAQADRPADAGSKSKRCTAVKKAFVLGGHQSAATDDAITVIDVTSRNRHARRYLGTATTYDLASAIGKDGSVVAPTFVGVTDRVDDPATTDVNEDDGNTTVGMEDVLATDKVKVKGYITVAKKGGKKKVCPGADSAVVVKSIRIVRPEPETAPAA